MHAIEKADSLGSLQVCLLLVVQGHGKLDQAACAITSGAPATSCLQAHPELWHTVAPLEYPRWVRWQIHSEEGLGEGFWWKDATAWIWRGLSKLGILLGSLLYSYGCINLWTLPQPPKTY